MIHTNKVKINTPFIFKFFEKIIFLLKRNQNDFKIRKGINLLYLRKKYNENIYK